VPCVASGGPLGPRWPCCSIVHGARGHDPSFVSLLLALIVKYQVQKHLRFQRFGPNLELRLCAKHRQRAHLGHTGHLPWPNLCLGLNIRVGMRTNAMHLLVYMYFLSMPAAPMCPCVVKAATCSSLCVLHDKASEVLALGLQRRAALAPVVTSGTPTCSSWLHTPSDRQPCMGPPRGPRNGRWHGRGRAAPWTGQWATCSVQLSKKQSMQQPQSRSPLGGCA